MAPPRHRDRGSSRRIQYGLFFGYVVAVAGIVAGLALVLVARFDPIAFEGIRGLALDITTPISTALRPIARGGGSVGDQIGDYLDAARKNAGLRAELASARRRLVEARMLAFENRRLKRIAGLVENGVRPIAVGRIVGSDLGGTRRFATLALGSADGVRSGQPVRGGDGLIGRVAETGAHASRVVLLTDGGSAVPLRVVRTGAAVLAEGRGAGALDIRSIVTGAPPLQRGDLLVTSGTGGVFPPDMPVATVVSAAGEVASARPLADPALIDYAMVLPLAASPPPLTPPTGKPR